ncbi:MAG: signal peptidase I [Lachnospiraceae bacterium]|nr:signal peptidase I [Lachnospiraceae bacterium]MCI9306692.1 signal peptidase I [Lachnospiraceae bacterium]
MGKKRRRNEIEDDFINERDEEKERSPFQELLGMLLYIGVVLVITFLIITFVGQRTHVSGDSMKNTLHHGDQLIVDKITYRFKEPVRYDIIVFPYQYEEDTFYIKRIIGLPGETVQIVNGEIYINGEILRETYGREVIRDPGMAAEPVQLGEDEYFVLGDNRNASSDSREPSVGVIHRNDIVGRAWIRIWPLNKAGILKHQ